MTSKVERFFHLLFFGHWPRYKFAPISDYMEWRVCVDCQAKRRAKRNDI